jgi:hypothetical protein
MAKIKHEGCLKRRQPVGKSGGLMIYVRMFVVGL